MWIPIGSNFSGYSGSIFDSELDLDISHRDYHEIFYSKKELISYVKDLNAEYTECDGFISISISDKVVVYKYYKLCKKDIENIKKLILKHQIKHMD